MLNDEQNYTRVTCVTVTLRQIRRLSFFRSCHQHDKRYFCSDRSKFSPLVQGCPLLPGRVLPEVQADQEGPKQHGTLKENTLLEMMELLKE